MTRRHSWGWRIGVGIGGALLVGIASVLTLPLWMPKQAIEQAIAAAVRQGIDRDLVFRGALRGELFPIRLVADDAVLTQHARGGAPPLVTAKTLSARVDLRRLLSGHITIDELQLDDPVFLFSVDGQGRPNWTTETGADAASKPAPAPLSPEEARRRAAENQGFSLDDIRINNGMLRYEDARSQSRAEIDAIGLHLSFPGIDKKLTGEGEFTWRGKPVGIALSLDDPGQLGGGGASQGQLMLTADPGKLTFDGHVVGQGSVLADGDLKLTIASVQQLGSWAGQSLSLPGPGIFSLAGRATLSRDKVDLADTIFSLDQIRGKGALAAALGGSRPNIQGSLTLEPVDLTPYLAQAPPKAVLGDWGATPLSLGTLPAVDLEVQLAAASVKADTLRLGQSRMRLGLRGNRLTADQLQVAFAAGRFAGTVLLDVLREGLHVETALRLERMQLETLIAAGGGSSRLSGVASADLRLSAHGQNVRGLIDSLAGTVRVASARTQIKGVHLPSLIGNVPGAAIAAVEGRNVPTDLATVAASFRVASGVARTDDLDIRSQAVRLTGSGEVDLGRRRLNLLLTPRILSSSAVSLVGVRLSGLMVPIRVEGPWDQPNYVPLPKEAVAQHLGDPLQAIKDVGATGPGAKGEASAFDPLGFLDRLFNGEK